MVTVPQVLLSPPRADAVGSIGFLGIDQARLEQTAAPLQLINLHRRLLIYTLCFHCFPILTVKFTAAKLQTFPQTRIVRRHYFAKTFAPLRLCVQTKWSAFVRCQNLCVQNKKVRVSPRSSAAESPHPYVRNCIQGIFENRVTRVTQPRWIKAVHPVQ